MNTDEIRNILKGNETTSIYFLDVFAVDQLPKQKINRDVWLLVCNCCPIDLRGEHWIAMFGSKEHIDVFDSFGLAPNAYSGVDEFLYSQKPKSVNYNSKCVQSISSDACGHYSILFCYHRARGVSLHDIVEAMVNMSRDEYVKYIVRFTL